MTEFREKLEQPELVVRGESTETSSGTIATSVTKPTSEEGPRPEAVSTPETAPTSETAPTPETAPIPEAAPMTETGSSTASVALPGAADLTGQVNPGTPSVPSEIELLNEKSSKHPKGPDTPGLKRHRIITGVCMALSLAVFGLSFTDLSGLFEKSGTLNSSLKFTEKNKKDRLPDNLDYYDNQQASEGLRAVRSSSWEDNLVGFVDETGNLVVPRKYLSVNDFSDGLASVRFSNSTSEVKSTAKSVSGTSERWGYIDKTGKTVIPPIYGYAGDFKNGVASVIVNDFGALIDKNGNIIRNSIDHSAPSRIGNLFSIRDENGLSGMVDGKGNYVVPPRYERIEKIGHDPLDSGRERDYDPDYLVVWENGRCGLLDQSGNKLIPLKYESISTYNRGYATVMHKGNYGMVDSKGNYLLEPKYKLITMYDDVIAALDHEQNWKLFDSGGKLLPTQIDGAIADATQPWLYDGMGAVIIGDKCGYVDSKGAIAISPKFDYAIRFSNGYGLVQQNGLMHYIDKTGKVATTLSFLTAGIFKNGRASVSIIGPLYKIFNGSQLESQAKNSSTALKKFVIGEGKT